MTNEEREKLADYFTPSELIELLNINTYELICAIEEFDGYNIFDEETLTDLEEIMGG